MIAGSLARRYARALLDIGVAKGTFEQLGKDMDDLAHAYSSSRDLVEALTNPVFPMARRRADLGRAGTSARWHACRTDPGAKPWSDDFSSPISVLHLR